MASTLPALLKNPDTLQPLLQRLPTIASVVLLVACAHVLSSITWMLLAENESQPLPAPTSTQAAPVSRQDDQQAFRRLTSAHLFGTVQQAPQPQATTAPETRLNLVLRGVLAADPMDMASAIISSGKSGKEEIYGVGDRMPGGVKLKEIHAEHVILDRQGRLETLRLIRDSGGGKENEQVLESISAARTGSAPQTLADIRKEIMGNPMSFSDYALPVVVKENGKQIGYRLQPQKKGKKLSELGIKPNDVITEVNGVKLNQPQNGMGALRKLSTAKEVNLVVKRNGAEVPLNIQLQ